MIKLAALALFPLVAATIYAPSELDLPTARVETRTRATESEIQDREFLTVLEVQAQAAARTARADRDFLANLQVQEMPVMKAIAVQRPAPSAVPAVSSTADRSVPEVRRAIAVSRSQPALQGSLHQTFLTMAAPEVRRALPAENANVNRDRAAITILGDQFIVRPKFSASWSPYESLGPPFAT